MENAIRMYRGENNNRRLENVEFGLGKSSIDSGCDGSVVWCDGGVVCHGGNEERGRKIK